MMKHTIRLYSRLGSSASSELDPATSFAKGLRFDTAIFLTGFSMQCTLDTKRSPECSKGKSLARRTSEVVKAS
jgi:hypothetical protein